MNYPLPLGTESLHQHPSNHRLIHLPDSARGMGIYLVAGRGSGKSRLLGRVIAPQDCWRGIPQVIWDAAGGLIDNFLDKINRLSPALQKEVWPRVKYVEMSGKFGVVTPWPFYLKSPSDTLYETSQRYLEVVKRLDPNLTSASIEGWNSLWEVGTHVGMSLTALNGQITEASDLLSGPEGWLSALEEASAVYPELSLSREFLSRLIDDKNAERRTKSFLNKVAVFALDPTMTAMFGYEQAGIDWAEVVAAGQTVLLDFRHELDTERRRLKMMWVFHSLLAFIKRRGAGRHTPIGLMIDELTTLFNFDTDSSRRLFAEDLDHLINVVARQYRVWLSLCHQELFQIDGKTRKTLMGMGTKIVGVTQDMEAALTLAQELLPYDPTRIKSYQPVYGGMRGQVTDLQPVSWALQEQQHLAAQLFTKLRPFHFVIKPAAGEGDVTGALYPLSIKRIDEGVFVDEEVVKELRKRLLEKQGLPLAEALAGVAARRQRFLKLKGSGEEGYRSTQGDVDDLHSFKETTG